MKSGDSFLKVTGILAIVVGILYLIIGVNYLFIPEAQKDYLQPEFWPSFSEKPANGIIQSTAFALIGLLALGLIPVITKMIRGESSDFLRWMMYLGLLGFAVHAVDEIRTMTLGLRIADAYVEGDSSTKNAIAALGLQHIDPLHICKFGLVGLWMIVINFYAITKKSLPTILCIIGIIGGLAFWLDLVGNVLIAIPIITIAAITAIVLGPIWFIWLGVVMRNRAGEA